MSGDNKAVVPAASIEADRKTEMAPPNKKDLENKTPTPQKATQEVEKGFLSRHRFKVIIFGLLLGVVIALASVPNTKFFNSGANYNVLSNQTFSFASTKDAVSFKSDAGAKSFVKAVCGPIGVDVGVINAIQVLDHQTYNNTLTLTIVRLYFSSWDMSSNKFRDLVRAKLAAGYLAGWDVIAFGEGFQNPMNFCPNGTYGLKCTTCGSCNDPLVCDDGTLGTGQCACPSVFMPASAFPYPGANLAYGRCLTISDTILHVDNISVEAGTGKTQPITIWNVGSTTESFSGANILAAPNMSAIVQNWLSISEPISWPQVLAPGDFLEVDVDLKPEDAGIFYAITLIFIDNDPSVWYDDVTTEVDIEFSATIAGQLPVDGKIRGQFALFRIDCGNGDSAELNGNLYDIDAWFGSFSNVSQSPSESNKVLGTWRYFIKPTAGNPMVHYTFPTKYTGDLTINLIFKDYLSTAAGMTVFDVYINGEVVSAGLDVFSLVTNETGDGDYLNLSYVYPSWNGSQIQLYFQSSSGNAFLNAIEILQTLDINVSEYGSVTGDYSINYADALTKSFLFFESMRSGPMYGDRRLLWRNDSCMECIGPNSSDLTGGYYEAGGNYLKFNYPMAWTLAQVAWGMLEFPEGFAKAGEWETALKTLKIGLDYFINSYINETCIVMSIGQAAKVDFNYFGPPELYSSYVKSRPIWYLTDGALNRSSETTAEVSALLTISSLVYAKVDAAYSAKLLDYAQKYYIYANKYQGSYMQGTLTGFTEMSFLYPSNSYVDELAWAAIWLYNATQASSFLADAQNYYKQYMDAVGGCGFAYSWEEKGPALHVVFSHYDYKQLSNLNTYRNNAKCYFDKWLPGSARSVPHTPRGLAYVLPWGSARYAANTALIAIMYAKALKEQGSSSTINYQQTLVAYAKNQTDYILGAKGRSYMHGVGAVYPNYMMHKSSYNSILYVPYRLAHGNTLINIQKEFQSSVYPQIHRTYGAVVGGPIKVNGLPSDFFIDSRVQYQYTEPALDYSASITSLIAVYCAEGYTCDVIDQTTLDFGADFVPPRI
eukprot:TRINITY_DN73_c0_g1_i1.p1 TRINITY_DN73_c0_g1~~TRINITY_DN73_c0_g1_i1.p1  ORF type:complete len:1051 (-),score=244.08 TRINITY_DN73_c0_g1_i1:65-3217(-)